MKLISPIQRHDTGVISECPKHLFHYVSDSGAGRSMEVYILTRDLMGWTKRSRCAAEEGLVASERKDIIDEPRAVLPDHALRQFDGCFV